MSALRECLPPRWLPSLVALAFAAVSAFVGQACVKVPAETGHAPAKLDDPARWLNRSLSADERARLLVCRELLAAPNAISIEIYEAGALLHTEWAPSAARSFEG